MPCARKRSWSWSQGADPRRVCSVVSGTYLCDSADQPAALALASTSLNHGASAGDGGPAGAASAGAAPSAASGAVTAFGGRCGFAGRALGALRAAARRRAARRPRRAPWPWTRAARSAGGRRTRGRSAPSRPRSGPADAAPPGPRSARARRPPSGRGATSGAAPGRAARAAVPGTSTIGCSPGAICSFDGRKPGPIHVATIPASSGVSAPARISSTSSDLRAPCASRASRLATRLSRAGADAASRASFFRSPTSWRTVGSAVCCVARTNAIGKPPVPWGRPKGGRLTRSAPCGRSPASGRYVRECGLFR